MEILLPSKGEITSIGNLSLRYQKVDRFAKFDLTNLEGRGNNRSALPSAYGPASHIILPQALRNSNSSLNVFEAGATLCPGCYCDISISTLRTGQKILEVSLQVEDDMCKWVKRSVSESWVTQIESYV